MNPIRPDRCSFFRHVAAVAAETLVRNRGVSFWIVLLAGCAAAFAAGSGLPGPEEKDQGLAACLVYSAMTLLLIAAALISGARGLAGDRKSGFRDVAGSKPLSAAAWFLGRFSGLAIHLTLAALFFTLAGGVGLSLFGREESFRKVKIASLFSATGVERDFGSPVLLPPDGSRVRWVFDSLDGASAGETKLHFSHRICFPRARPFQGVIPLEVTAKADGKKIARVEIEVRLRKKFSLALPAWTGRDLEVFLSIRGGDNFLETGRDGCSLVYDETGPVVALFASVFSFLPMLWLSIATALFFSSFVSEPSALFASTVMVLIVAAGPSLKANLRLAAAGSPDSIRMISGENIQVEAEDDGLAALALKGLAASAAKMIALLPDPSAGGSAGPLSRGECPNERDIFLPWKEGAVHLVLVLVLGALVASWRRP